MSSVSLSSERLRLQDAFLKMLAGTDPAMKAESAWVVVETPDGPEAQWVIERWFVMFEEVNRQRKLLRKDPVELQAVKDADRMASGHTDYAEKFSLYCAELVLS